MARPKKKVEGERAAAILDAADALLAEVGYEGISARAVAERAGVNKALVFYYYGSVENLFERELERYYTAHGELLARALEGFRRAPDDVPLAERLHGLIDVYLDFIEHNRLYARLVQQQVSGGGMHLHLVERHLRAFYDWTSSLLAEMAPATGRASARQLYLTFSAAVINYFTYAPLLGDDVWEGDALSAAALAERRAHVHWLVDTLLAALAAEKPDAR